MFAEHEQGKQKKAHRDDLFVECEQGKQKKTHREDNSPARGYYYLGVIMKFIFLTQQFYDDYKDCIEIEKKHNRPYMQVVIKIKGIQFAIPFRSGIKHDHAFWTDKKNNCGLDISKTVVIKKDEYVNKTKTPYIRKVEYDALRGKEYQLKQRLLKYISEFKNAKNALNISKNKLLYNFSALQYFEKEIEDITTEL